MKTTCLAVAAVSLLQIVSAQPHRRRHAHGVQHQNVKKEDVVITVVDTVYAQASEYPVVNVYVDENGNPVSTTTEYVKVSQGAWSTAFGVGPSATAVPVSSSSSSTSTSIPAVENVQVAVASSPTPEPSSTTIIVSEVQPSAAAPAPATTEAAPVVPTTPAQAAAPVAPTTAAEPVVVAPTTAQAAPAASTSAATSSGSSSGSSGFGVVYSPYNGDGTCKTQSQVNKDFESLTGYGLIRIYGTDCNQVSTVLSVAKAKGFKLFAGVYNIANVNSEVATIISAAAGDWSQFETISIGNEVVNSGTASASAVVAAIGTARALLKAAGFTGNVVTVDTLVAARDNPSLCDASDFCAVNCHPFFDGSYVAADSGKFLADMIPTLSAKLANKNQKIVITETGWPWQGQSNGKAVPSLDNQNAALSSIKAKFASSPSSIILFTAFNDMWKKNTAAQFGAEQFWGMGGSNPPSG